MKTMATIDWIQGYRLALDRAREAVQRSSRAACGFTNNVDIVVQVVPDILAPFRSRPSQLLTGEMPTALRRPADLANTLLHCIVRGIGGDVPVQDASLADWMRAHFDGPTQIGGTGARAANTLAFLGFPALMHVTGLSPLEAALHESSGRLTVAAGQKLLPPQAAARTSDDPMFHYIFEYQAGVPLDFGATIITPGQSNRIITSYDHRNMIVQLDLGFLSAIEDARNQIDRVLISGFSQMAHPSLAHARIANLIAHIRRWRESQPVLVHQELASIIQPEIAADILGIMSYNVDSLGLNAEELPLLAAALDLAPPQTIAGQVDVLARFKERTGLKRINLHTQAYCLSVTDSEPEEEQVALFFAALVAGTRAATGRYPSLGALGTLLDTITVRPDTADNEAQLARHYQLLDGIGHCQAGWVVYVPTLDVDQPVTTVGLGDTFTGALLALLRPRSAP